MTGPATPPAVPAGGSVRALFEETRKRFVDTGIRNRLVHVNRGTTRAQLINIVNERSDEVYAMLAAGRSLRFRALGSDAPDAGDLTLADRSPEPVPVERQTDRNLETRLGPDALQKRLLSIAREARTAEEEQGVNVLYLALGFLTWVEDRSPATAREAPLVLLPVELTRNPQTSTYDVRLRDEDLPTNLPLRRRLQGDFGLELPELEADDEWRPSRYFEQVETMIAGRAGWAVDRDGSQLGFFSFAKLLMFLDLDDASWPAGELPAHPLTRGLLFEGFRAEPPLFGPGRPAGPGAAAGAAVARGRRRRLPDPGDRGGPNRAQPGGAGPAGHRQEPDDHQHHRRRRKGRPHRAVHRREDGRAVGGAPPVGAGRAR